MINKSAKIRVHLRIKKAMDYAFNYRNSKFIFFISIAFLFFGCSSPKPGPVARIGAPAPDFTLTDISGNKHQLSEYRGKAVVLNFWATWCLPCRREMPELQAAYDAYKDRGLVILGINQHEPKYMAEKFAGIFGVTFPILLNESGNLDGHYVTHVLPSTYFIDTAGVVRGHVTGMIEDFNKTFRSQISAGAGGLVQYDHPEPDKIKFNPAELLPYGTDSGVQQAAMKIHCSCGCDMILGECACAEKGGAIEMRRRLGYLMRQDGMDSQQALKHMAVEFNARLTGN